MHQHKRFILETISKQLSIVVNNKKNELKRTLDTLRVVITEKQEQLNLDDLSQFKAFDDYINKLFEVSNVNTSLHLNKLQLVIERFITFIRVKIAPYFPHHQTEINSSVNKFLYILEEQLQKDCLQLLNEIKNTINQNYENQLFLQLIKNQRELINVSPANPVSSHKLYLLIKGFLQDLHNSIQSEVNVSSRSKYKKEYVFLLHLFEKLQKKNRYYLNDEHFENGSARFTFPFIKGAQAPSRTGNELHHFLNAYEDMSKSPTEIEGVLGTIIRHIKQAKHIICIAGWEIDLHLDYLQPTMQGHNGPKLETMGEILVQKAIDNPTLVIAIKVWAQFFDKNIKYHHDSIPYLDSIAKAKGLKNGLTDLPNLQFRAVNHSHNFNTHHAKTVITDVVHVRDDSTSSRVLEAFYGGLGLSRIRMDDWHHFFYHDANAYGWRDVHQQIIGPVVADILNDFASSWHNANHGFLKYWNKWTKDKADYCSFERFCRNISNTHLLQYDDLKYPGALWNSQFLRSTTSKSHHSFWAATKPYENSIAQGYKQAINEAQHCIELETQYLIGGPGIHTEAKHAEFNPIPQALVDKIIERDKVEVPFHIFITLPMLPNTNSAPGKIEMDSIRAAQWSTIKWMMHTIEEQTKKP